MSTNIYPKLVNRWNRRDRIWPVTSAALPLDAFSGPAPSYAYAFRKLLAAYAGNCYQVRRTSDSIQLDVGWTAGNLVDAAAAEAHCAATNGTLSAWYNQMGGVSSAQQLAIASQPLTVTAGVHETLLGGGACMVLDAVDDYLVESVAGVWGLYPSDEATMFYVLQDNATLSGLGSSTDGGGVIWAHGFYGAGAGSEQDYVGNAVWTSCPGIVPAATRKTAAFTRKTGETLKTYVDGVLDGVSAGNADAPLRAELGAFLGYSPPNFWGGKIESCLLFLNRLTGAQVLELHNLLA